MEISKARNVLLLQGVSMLALSVLTVGATAQTVVPAAAPAASEAKLDEIVVTGFRRSLATARERKKQSDTIVDSVSADDIGALPDRSVTETLQRIPGISINRFSAGIDPDHFSAEGSGVVVRGLTYVRSEFNGRDAFTANNGRALGFSDVPSELLGGVDVYKSLPADHIEGGIAGTVDLRTRRPFDSTKNYFAGAVEYNYSDFAKKASPNISAVASHRWDTDIGEIGVLASGNYSQLFSRSDRIALSHFKGRCYSTASGVTTVVAAPDPGTACPAGTSSGLIPSGAVEGTQQFDRRRLGASAAVQWTSPDKSVEAIFQFIHSDAKEAWSEHTIEVTTDNVDSHGGVVAAPGTALNFDSSGLFTDGVITGNTGWRNDQNTPGSARVPIDGLQSNNIRRDHEEQNISNDFSGNIKWKATDRLTVAVDFQHVTSKVSVDDNTLWGSTYQDASIKVNGNGLPAVAFLPPTNCTPNCNGAVGTQNNPSYFTTGHNSFTDPYNAFYRAAMDHTERSDGHENAAKIDLKYDFSDHGFLRSVKTGYRFADRKQTARFSTYNWGVLSEQWGGKPGPVWLDTPIAGNNSQPLSNIQVYDFPNFFGGAVASPGGAGRLFYATNTVKNYAQYSADALAIAKQWGNGGTWVPLASRVGVVPGTPFLPGEINPAVERNNAAYIMANFGSDFADGMKLTGNAGVRYTRTNRTSTGGSFVAASNNTFAARQLTCATPTPTPDAFCLLGADVQAALIASNTGGAAAYVPSVAKLTYDFWLPSVNLKLEVGNGLQFRAAYFKGVAPPDFGLTRNYLKIDGISVVTNPANPTVPFLAGAVTAGNPYLLPTSSDNYDITAEYYFGHGGQITASLFYKELKNIVVSCSTSSLAPAGATQCGGAIPTTVNVGSAIADITSYQPYNSPNKGKVKGFELSYQQNYTFLPGLLGGLGLQANYTFVDSKGVPQSTLSSTDPNVAAGNISNIPGTNFPLQGLSKHSFNIVPFYEKGPLTLRAAYTWRSQYLLTLRDVITPFDPIFQRAYGQLDSSITYSFSDRFKIGIEGVNLLNSLVETSAAVYDQNKTVVLVPRAWYKTDRRFTLSARLNF